MPLTVRVVEYFYTRLESDPITSYSPRWMPSSNPSQRSAADPTLGVQEEEASRRFA
jgi:hypothetical protein